jgi:hypothetical protein
MGFLSKLVGNRSAERIDPEQLMKGAAADLYNKNYAGALLQYKQVVDAEESAYTAEAYFKIGKIIGAGKISGNHNYNYASECIMKAAELGYNSGMDLVKIIDLVNADAQEQFIHWFNIGFYDMAWDYAYLLGQRGSGECNTMFDILEKIMDSDELAEKAAAVYDQGADMVIAGQFTKEAFLLLARSASMGLAEGKFAAVFTYFQLPANQRPPVNSFFPDAAESFPFFHDDYSAGTLRMLRKALEANDTNAKDWWLGKAPGASKPRCLQLYGIRPEDPEYGIHKIPDILPRIPVLPTDTRWGDELLTYDKAKKKYGYA